MREGHAVRDLPVDVVLQEEHNDVFQYGRSPNKSASYLWSAWHHMGPTCKNETIILTNPHGSHVQSFLWERLMAFRRWKEKLNHRATSLGKEASSGACDHDLSGITTKSPWSVQDSDQSKNVEENMGLTSWEPT